MPYRSLHNTLYASDARRDQEGMQRSSELVMQLHGAEPAADTADGAYDMVFGRPQGELGDM